VYGKVILGGTFSLFHRGHRHLLKVAAKLAGNELLVGVTSDEYVTRNPKPHPVEPYEVRALRVLLYCIKAVRRGVRVCVFPLDDPFGPLISEPRLNCVVVSEETFPRAVEANILRKKKGLKPLPIVAVEMVTDEEGRPLSSTALWARGLAKQELKHLLYEEVPGGEPDEVGRKPHYRSGRAMRYEHYHSLDKEEHCEQG